jgi:HlyD family secretion protein
MVDASHDERKLVQDRKGLTGWLHRVSLLQPAWIRLRTAAKLLWKWRVLVIALAAACVALMYFGPALLFGPVVSADRVTRADLVQTVVASGNVAAPYRVNIGSQTTGTVVDVPVAEGQAVKAGDKLILLDDRAAHAQVALAQAAVEQAEARMRQMTELTLPSAKATLTQAQATLVDAQATYDRAAKLSSEGYATKVTLDDAKKALDIAAAQVRNAEFQVATDTPGGSDYVMAETLLNQARATLTSAQSLLSYTVITAPRDGTLILRNVERGYIVQPLAILMVLSPTGTTQIVVQIDEKNFGLIAIGQKAIASADAFPKEQLAAEVAYINPGINLQTATVEVKLDVANPPAHLQQDMTVSVDVEVARHPAVLLTSATDLRDANTDQPWVMKVRSGRAVHQRVRVGIISAGRAEILDGLAEGDLILPASSQVNEGTRVRARQMSASKT